MSGVDPLAALAAEAGLQQSTLAAIDLGVQIEILQQQLSIGDLITATILPPQGGSDRLSLLGQTVLAQLPPGIDPGQSLLLQITGFSGNQILVRSLGTVDPNNPPPTVNVTLPQPSPGTPSQATLTTIISPQPNPNSPVSAQTPNVQTPSAQTPSAQTVAPPAAVFVAASVKPAQTAAALAPEIAQTVLARDVAQLGIEARIAATHAASLDIAELVNAPGKPNAPSPSAQGLPAAAAQRAVPARPATPSPLIAAPRVPLPIAQRPVATPTQAPIAPELALLARLRIPTLTFTLAAARLAATASTALPRALARLDTVLASVVQDARAASVRTLLPFVARIDPSNARALPEQLMSFVSNVVDGAESKLASIVRALLSLPVSDAPHEETPPIATSKFVAPAQPESPAPTPPAATAPRDPVAQASSALPAEPTQLAAPATPPAVAAHVAERAVALQYDLKAAIVSMIESPPHGAPAALAPALAQALTAVTAVQLNVLNAQNTDPSTIAIPLPVFYHENGRPVQLRISRDAPKGSGKLDADNFHIAFVLDTRSLGTVAVDLQTASRSVSVNVKTEGTSAAGRFKETLHDLRGRLEGLHYRVANIAAGVAPQHRAPNDAVILSGASEGRAVEGRTSNLDLRA